MPLEILGPLVVVGIGGIVLLIHLLGWSATRVLADEAEVAAMLIGDFPEVSVKRVALGDDGASALVETAEGLGLVRAMGVGWLTRLLGAGAASAQVEGDEVHVYMADFGAPEVSIRLADAESRAAALDMARRALGESE